MYNRNVECIFIVYLQLPLLMNIFPYYVSLCEQWIYPFEPTRHDWYHKKYRLPFVDPFLDYFNLLFLRSCGCFCGAKFY